MKSELLTYLLTVTHEARCNKDGQIPESTILETTDNIAKVLGLPAVLTYEGIVLVNPLYTPDEITFSQGKTADAERLFYKVHADIEGSLFGVVSSLLSIYDLHNPRKTEIIEVLKGVKEGLDDSVKKISGLYRELNPSDFQDFRGYFQAITFRNLNGIQYPGPSGASSAAFPTIDILFGIADRPSLGPLAEVVMPRLSNRGYTTIQDLIRARTLVVLYGDLHFRFKKDSDIAHIINDILTILRKFRLSHRAIVTKFLPEAMENSVSGTGGAMNVPEYLDTVIRNTKLTI